MLDCSHTQSKKNFLETAEVCSELERFRAGSQSERECLETNGLGGNLRGIVWRQMQEVPDQPDGHGSRTYILRPFPSTWKLMVEFRLLSNTKKFQ